MPTYDYETIPQSESEEPTRFEVWQRMADEPLTEHPETGQPIHRQGRQQTAAAAGVQALAVGVVEIALSAESTEREKRRLKPALQLLQTL